MKTVILNPLKKSDIDDSIINKWQTVGGNPGNLIFFESIKKELNYSDIIFVDEYEKVDNKTVVVVPSSNFLMRGGNDSFYQGFINFFKHTDCKIVFVGLGAQSTKFLNTPERLVKYGIKGNPVKMEFFKIMSQRSEYIGVRGSFTGKCLDLLGIHNYKIIGCPSMFVWLDGVFPEIKAQSLERIHFSISPGKSFYKKNVLKVAMKYNCDWIVQSKSELVPVISLFNHSFINPKWLIRRFPGMLGGREVIEFSKKQKCFFSIDEWKKYYEENDITFAWGTRFHGNMAALQNGIPALWVVHDSRTKELTEFLNLPAIDIKSINMNTRVEELILFADYKKTQGSYRKLCKNYTEFLEANSINHNYKL